MPRFLATNIDLSAGPPPEVLQQIDVAWKRARDLFDSSLEIHYEIDAEHGRLSAQLRAFDGSLVERLSVPEALALACGDAPPGIAQAS